MLGEVGKRHREIGGRFFILLVRRMHERRAQQT